MYRVITSKYIIALFVLIIGGCAFGEKKITTPEGYVTALQRHVSQRLYLPSDYPEYSECKVYVKQDNTGSVTAIDYGVCDAEDSVIEAIENAIKDSSPFPLPEDMALFDSELLFRFCPDCF